MAKDHGFRVEPFSKIASRENAACWAARDTSLTQLKRIAHTLTNTKDSTLDLIWASFGAGKSHALYHLEYLLGGCSTADKFFVAHIEIPDQVKKFLDLYTLIIDKLPVADIARVVHGSGNTGAPKELQHAAYAMHMGDPHQKEVSCQWLSGRKPHLQVLRPIGIDRRIEDDAFATEILAGIIRAVAASGRRMVLMFDEYQRVGQLTPESKRLAVLSRVRSLFSQNACGLSVILAATSQIEKNSVKMIPPELRTIMGNRPTVSLPQLSLDEAMQFVLERFKFFRTEGYSNTSTHPFRPEAIELSLAKIESSAGNQLIPRTILESLGWIYDDPKWEKEKTISQKMARESLNDLRWDESQ